jgi:anti-anti-sigma factor
MAAPDDFRITPNWWDGQVTLAVAGELDLDTAPELETRLRECLAAHPRVLRLDFSGVTFCDCSGANVLISARAWAQTQGIALRVERVRDPKSAWLLDAAGLGDLVEK